MQKDFSKLKGLKTQFSLQNKGNLGFENVAEQFGLNVNPYTNGTAYGDLANVSDLVLIQQH